MAIANSNGAYPKHSCGEPGQGHAPEEEPGSIEVRALLERIRQGDEDAIRELWNGYEERLCRLVEARIRRESEGSPMHDVRAQSIVMSRLEKFIFKVREGRYTDTKSHGHL